MAGLALFLVSLLLKFLLVALAAFVLVRVVGRQLANRAFGSLERQQWPSSTPISIDNPAYRSGQQRADFARIIPIQ